MLDHLEYRRLLSVDFDHGVVTVVGKPGADDIELLVRDGELRIFINGEQELPGKDDGKNEQGSLLIEHIEAIIVRAGGGNDRVLVNPEVPATSVSGGSGSDTLIGGDGDDTLAGDDGDDHLGGGGGADLLRGGDDFDSADYRFRTDDLALSIDGDANDGGDGGAERDNIALDVERIVAGTGDDRIDGSPDDNSITAGGGDDTVSGGGGDDSIDGDEGADSLMGDGGDDRITGGVGRDTLDGGDDDDAFLAQDNVADELLGGPGDGDALLDFDEDLDSFIDVELNLPIPRLPEVVVRLGLRDISVGEGDIDFGAVDQGDGGPTRTFTVRNDGNGVLRLADLAVPAGFTISEGLDETIAPGDADTFTVRMQTTTIGAPSGDVTFTTNDADEPAYSFTINGTVNAPPEPEIAVSRGGQNLADGGSIDFGSATQGMAAPSLVFTIRNTGDGVLRLSDLTVPAGFAIAEGIDATIAPGASDTFTLRMRTDAVGAQAGVVSFVTNDGDENPFNFRVEGVVTPPKRPDIAVSLGQRKFTDGAAGVVNFGKLAQNSGKSRTLTFTVVNSGNAALAPGKITLPRGFTLVDGLSASLKPSQSDALVVRFDGGKAGAFSGALRIANNDPDENPFDIPLIGTVTAPDIAVKFGKTAIADGAKKPVNFGIAQAGRAAPTRTFTIVNTGTAALKIASISLPDGYSMAKAPARVVNPGKSAPFTVRLDAGVAGRAAGRIVITSSDPDAEKTYDFPITGTVRGVGATQSGGTLLVTGTGGDDNIVLSGAGGTVTVSANGSAVGTFAGVAFVDVAGAAGNDRLAASAISIPVRLSGGAGNDTLLGGRGADTLLGGDDNDSLTGGLGSDEMHGEGGADAVNGADGTSDTMVDGGPGNDRIRTDPTDSKSGT